MKLIKPSEISGRILTLLDESDEKVIIVSPYMKISKWYKLTNKINRLKNRGVRIEIYVRDDPGNIATFHDLDQLALEHKRIPHLHSKLYLNEKSGIVSSMNLLLSSEMNSLEIGYETETWNEYKHLFSYYQRYILSGTPVHSRTLAGLPTTDPKQIILRIRSELKMRSKNSWLWLAENALHISTGRNSYTVSFSDQRLKISALIKIRSTERHMHAQRYSLIVKKIEDLSTMKVFMQSYPHSNANPTSQLTLKPTHQPGAPLEANSEIISDIDSDLETRSKTYAIELSGQAHQSMKSTFITGIVESESEYVLGCIIKFICATDDLVVPGGFNAS